MFFMKANIIILFSYFIFVKSVFSQQPVINTNGKLIGIQSGNIITGFNREDISQKRLERASEYRESIDKRIEAERDSHRKDMILLLEAEFIDTYKKSVSLKEKELELDKKYASIFEKEEILNKEKKKVIFDQEKLHFDQVEFIKKQRSLDEYKNSLKQFEINLESEKINLDNKMKELIAREIELNKKEDFLNKREFEMNKSLKDRIKEHFINVFK